MTERRVNRGRRKEDFIVKDRFFKLRKIFVGLLITAFLVSAMTALHFYWKYQRALDVIENIVKYYAEDSDKKD